MFIRCFAYSFGLVAVMFLVSGCGPSSSKPNQQVPSAATSVPTNHSDLKDEARTAHKDGMQKEGDANHGHSHERDKMLIADAGSIHALLTAHLATGGNELDIFLETPDAKDPRPVAIDAESIEAQATAGEGESQTLLFEPAPADERPAGESAGKCSHFVAKAPWMKPEDDLLVVAKFSVNGKAVVGRWKNFNPRKYAHHIE